MPLYEYQCEKCGEHFEVIEKFVDDPLTLHEKCGGNVHRLISAPALKFKGSGWYVTDYAKSEKTADKGEKSTPDGGAKKTDGPANTSSSGSDSGSSSSSAVSESKSETKPSSSDTT